MVLLLVDDFNAGCAVFLIFPLNIDGVTLALIINTDREINILKRTFLHPIFRFGIFFVTQKHRVCFMLFDEIKFIANLGRRRLASSSSCVVLIARVKAALAAQRTFFAFSATFAIMKSNLSTGDVDNR